MSELNLSAADVGKKFKRAGGGEAEIVGWDYSGVTPWYALARHPDGSTIWHNAAGISNIDDRGDDLIARIYGAPQFSWNRFLRVIDADPGISDTVKRALRDAVAAGAGETPAAEDTKSKPEPKRGQIWKYIGKGRYSGVLYLVSQDRVLINLNGDGIWSSSSTFGSSGDDDFEFVAASLADYIAAGGEI